jgi:UTP--glucose-1-phosphate uridylyltransferase
MKITKAIIAVAGYGTRFLPATKVQPKQMIPIIDKPIIQYVVEEVVASGIETVILVTRAGCYSLEDHFDSSSDLENQLENSNKHDLLKTVKKIPRLAHFVYLRQTKDYPYGNGTPLLVAQNLIAKDEPFVFMFGDDIVKSKTPAIKQLINLWKKNPNSIVIAAQEVPKEDVSRYGIVKLKRGTKNHLESIVEKPSPSEAPSRLAQLGRFVLNKKIIDILARRRLGKGGELWLTDAIAEYAKKHKVLVAKIEGKWLTTDDPLRWIKATLELALTRPDLKVELKNYLRSLKV